MKNLAQCSWPSGDASLITWWHETISAKGILDYKEHAERIWGGLSVSKSIFVRALGAELCLQLHTD